MGDALTELGINGWNLIAQLIAFLIFLWLLWRLALGPIVRVLDERRDRIRDSVEAAERMQAELKATAARNEQVLAEARRDAQQIVVNAREAGDAAIARAREAADAQAAEYLSRAQSTLRQETESARQGAAARSGSGPTDRRRSGAQQAGRQSPARRFGRRNVQNGEEQPWPAERRNATPRRSSNWRRSATPSTPGRPTSPGSAN